MTSASTSAFPNRKADRGFLRLCSSVGNRFRVLLAKNWTFLSFSNLYWGAAVIRTTNAHGAAATRQFELRLLEDALNETRFGAEAIQEPVLVQFIDVAIAEVQRIRASLRETPRTHVDCRSPNIIDFVSSSANLRRR